MSQYTVRPMSRDEMDWALQQAANEGWNPGLHDAEAFYSTDPEGFIIALQGDKPVGAISAVRYDDADVPFGFIGCYIVAEAHRAGSAGLLLARAAMRRLRDCNIGQDGVFENVEKYSRLGFTLAYRNLRQRFTIPQSGVSPADAEELTVLPAVDASWEYLMAYDRRCFPAGRSVFLKQWLTLPESLSLACQDAAGTMQGFGTIRPCREGYKIGPLSAENKTVADTLFRSLVQIAKPGETVYLDTPEPNAEAMALAKDYDMEEVFGTARMYSRSVPNLELDRIFGVTTFELG